MKIGILTHYIHYGYGGLLQNYALQTVLKRMGHDPITLKVAFNKKVPFKKAIRNMLSFGAHILLHKDMGITVQQDDFITQYNEPFISKYLAITKPLRSSKDFQRATIENKCEVLVAGSDQIWRKYYSYVSTCYLDFAKDMDIKRVAYAASFAVDNWEYTEEETRRYRKLAQKFDAISVRESSGIRLCKEFLNVDAQLVLDPTMLLEKEDYIKLVEEAGEKHSEGELFSYVLDKNPEKDNIINGIASKFGLRRYECMPLYPTTYYNVKNHPKDSIYPPVTKWLRSIMDASCVVTDSFHGTVFSIIFNKPFFVLINENRGSARFTSLLSLFGLESRIITEIEDVDERYEIDWEQVSLKKELIRNSSMSFLNNALIYNS